MTDIALERFFEAKKVLSKTVINTPLVPTPFLCPGENPILLKAECLQLSGSFKIRGATYAISRLSPHQKAKGVIAYSTGNHAQAVALAAKMQHIKATIVLSPDVAPHKLANVQAFGAEVVMTNESSKDRQKVAEELSKKHGFALIPPYDHEDVITGQGTIGLEIVEAIDPAAVFVPVGGGGLIAGIACAIKKQKPDIQIIGVEPELENDAVLSFQKKKIQHLPQSSTTLADAVKVSSLGAIPFPMILNYVDDMVTVSEKEIAQATLECARNTHLIVEPAGALALAAALQYSKKIAKDKPVICIASGGNTTLPYLMSLASKFE